MADLRTGAHRAVAIILLFGAFAGFAVMLGGVASLQQACVGDLDLSSSNDVLTVKAFLQKVDTLAATDPAELATPTGQLLFLQGTAQSLAILAQRSVTGAFSLTPDTQCSLYYRYAWLATSVQFFAICVAVAALAAAWLHIARVAICSLLTISTMLCIENAHAFLYEKDFAPGVTLTRGKVFFAGCIASIAANMLLMCILGCHDESLGAVTHGDDAHVVIEHESAIKV